MRGQDFRVTGVRSRLGNYPNVGRARKPNAPNEAKRLLKTKENVFPTSNKAKRHLKIKELFIESQEVIDRQGFMRLPGTRKPIPITVKIFDGFHPLVVLRV